MRTYGILGLCTPFAFARIPVVSPLALLIVLVGVVVAYRLRANKAPDGLLAAHGRWMVRTFWISSVYLLASMVLAGIISSIMIDPAAMQALNEGLKAAQDDAARITALLQEFNATNHAAMLVSTLVTLCPVVLFVMVRCYYGYRLADKGQVPARPAPWLLK